MDFFSQRFLPFGKNGFKQISLKTFFENFFNQEIKFEDIKLKRKILLIGKREKKKNLNESKKYLIFRKNAFSKNFSLGRDFELFLISLGQFSFKPEKNISDTDKIGVGGFKLLVLLKNWAKSFKKFSSEQKIEFLIFLGFLSLNKNFEIRHKSKKIILKVTKRFGLATIIPLLRDDLGNKKEGIRKLVVHILTLTIINLEFSNYLPYIRALFYKTKTWKTRFSICQILQSIIKNSNNLNSFEFLEIAALIESVLNEKKKKLRGTGAMLLSKLCKNNSKKNLKNLSFFFFSIFDRLKEEKTTTLAIFIEAGSSFVKILNSKKMFYFTKELLEISLHNLPNEDITIEKILLKTVFSCLEKIGLETDKIIKRLSSFFDLVFWNLDILDIRKNLFLYSKIISWFLHNTKSRFFFPWKFDTKLSPKKLEKTSIIIDLIRLEIKNNKARNYDPKIFQNVLQDLITLIERSRKLKLNNEKKILMKSAHKTLTCFLRSSFFSTKSFLPRITGLLKWEINSSEMFIRKCALKTIKKISYLYKKFKERIILGHIGVILFNYIKSINSSLVVDLIYGLESIIRDFPPDYCIPPLQKIIPEILFLMEKKKEIIGNSFFKIIFTITKKGSIFLPRKEQFHLIIILIQTLKGGVLQSRKFSMTSVSKLGKIIGPLPIVHILTNYLMKSKKKFSISLSLLISLLAIDLGPQFIFPKLLIMLNSGRNQIHFNFFFTLICLAESLTPLLFFHYINPVCLTLEKIFKDQTALNNPILFLVIGQIFRKTRNYGLISNSGTLIEKIWLEFYLLKKETLKFAIFSLKTLPIHNKTFDFFSFLTRGLFHPSEKNRRFFWKFFYVLNLKNFPALINFYLISGSNRFNSGEDFC